jgi:hypothetical protein
MDCWNCGVSIPDGAKFCPECGARQERKCIACGATLLPGAKFCHECGTEVASSAQTARTSATPNPPLSLAPYPFGLPPCAVAVEALSAEWSGGHDCMTFRASYTVKNPTSTAWDLLSVRAHLLGSAGQVIATEETTHDQTIEAGDDASFEASWAGVERDLLGPTPDTATVVIEVLACTRTDAELGRFPIPDWPFEISQIPPAVVGDTLRIVSGSIWKSEPDDDNECSLEVKLLVQNLTDQHLPLVRLSAQVLDSNEDEVGDAGTVMDLAPSGVCLLPGYHGGIEPQTLDDATVSVAVQVFKAVATGTCVAMGLRVDFARSTEGGMDAQRGCAKYLRPTTNVRSVPMEKFSRLCRINLAVVEGFPDGDGDGGSGYIETKLEHPLWCLANVDEEGALEGDEYRFVLFQGEFREAPDFFTLADEIDPEHPAITSMLEQFKEMAGDWFDSRGMTELILAGLTWPSRGEEYLDEFAHQPCRAEAHLVSETLISDLFEFADRKGVLISWENNLDIEFDAATGRLFIDGRPVASEDDLFGAFSEPGDNGDELLILVEPSADEDDE